MDRRRFVKVVSAGVAGAAVAGRAEAARLVWPSDQIRLGVIGVGSRGQEMLAEFLRHPGVRVIALCDVYEPRFAQARAITGEDTPVYRDFRRMLDERAAELDAVLVASPLLFHAEHVVAALEAGLHVYGEKSMAYDVAGCRRIAEAARRSGRVYLIGHQYRYAPFAREAVRRIHAGEIGEVTHVFAYWHRNNNWRRAVPGQPVSGYTAEQLERLINWRLYQEYSRGLLTELGSHQVDLTNWIFGALPQAVVGTGAITFYRDGRETFDNVQATFEYPGGRRLAFSSLLGNHKMAYQFNVFGTGGTLEMTLVDATFYYEPARANSAVPERRPAALDSILREGAPTGPTLGTQGDLPYRGPGHKVETAEQASPNHLAVADFLESIRERRRPFADERVGLGSGLPVIFADEATRAGGRVEFGAELAALSAAAGA